MLSANPGGLAQIARNYPERAEADLCHAAADMVPRSQSRENGQSRGATQASTCQLRGHLGGAFRASPTCSLACARCAHRQVATLALFFGFAGQRIRLIKIKQPTLILAVDDDPIIPL